MKAFICICLLFSVLCGFCAVPSWAAGPPTLPTAAWEDTLQDQAKREELLRPQHWAWCKGGARDPEDFYVSVLMSQMGLRTTDAQLILSILTPEAIAHLDQGPILVAIPQKTKYGKIRVKAFLITSAKILAAIELLRLRESDSQSQFFAGNIWDKWYDAWAGINDGFGDGDNMWRTNIRDHGFEGALVYMAFLKNYPRALATPIGWTKDFAITTLYTTGVVALFSFQFELGPFGEATTGRSRKGRQGVVDLIFTELFGMVIATIERYNYVHIVRPMIHSRRKIVRIFGYALGFPLTPSRTVVSLLDFDHPYRDWGER